MNLEEIRSIILRLEEKYPVDEWVIGGIDIWPYIRIDLFMRLSSKALGANELNTRSMTYFMKLIGSSFAFLKALILDSKNNSTLKKTDVLFISDGVSFEFVNDSWMDKFCDPRILKYKESGKKTLTLCLENNYHYPRLLPSKFIQFQINIRIIFSILCSKLNLIKRYKNELVAYDKFCQDTLLLECKQIYNIDWLDKKVHKLKVLRSYFLQILKETSPEKVYIVSYYYDGSMSLINACRQLDIPSYDIQHGVQSSFHLAYSHWSKVPKSGYASIPDFFSVWSELEKIDVQNWSNKCLVHKPQVDGNLYLNLWKDRKYEVGLYYDKKVNDIFPTTRKMILYSMSPNIQKEVTSIIFKVIAQTQNNYNWLIRLHPGMRDKMEEIKDEIFEYGITQYDISNASQLPLFAILRNINIHITEQSSVVIEAAEFEIQSILTTMYGKNLFENLIDSNSARYTNDSSEIIAILKEI